MLDLINISIQYGGKVLFENVNYRINKDDKISLVGANGTGKSTLLKMIKGLEQPETGYIEKSKKLKIGYLQQEFINLKGKSLFEEVKTSLTEYFDLEQREKEVTSLLNDQLLSDEKKISLTEELGNITHRKDEIDYYRIDSNIEKVLEGLGFKEADFSRLTTEFSGGWQMRIELAKILLDNNDLILLDEPTNHLDLDTLRWLIDYLKNFRGALIVVSHDRYFINQITSKTLEIYNQKLSLYNGKFDDYQIFKTERDKQLESEFIQQQKKIKETEKFIERFRYKATKAKQVQSRVKQLEKLDLVELINQEKKINIKFPEPPRSGVVPIELKNIFKSYGVKKVFEGINFSLQRGEKIAFVGPNGAGKTTLSKIIAEQTSIDSGEIIPGHNTMISYYAQEVAENLNPENDVLESVAEVGTELSLPQLRTLLGTFLFTDDDVFKKVQILSGGEKSRVALARILLKKSNLIILDEPTNHLDMSSKEILQKALMDFEGTLIIVSHDIEFLKPVINKVIEIRDGSIKEFMGGIEYYLEKAELSVEKKAEQNKNQEDDKVTRKDQKRLEADLRQQRYKATKDIVKKIEQLELKIQNSESHKTNVETELGKEEVFSNPSLAKEKNQEYEEVKKLLNYLYDEWTILNDQLENIEKEFTLPS